jgi:hypothetical protein
MPAIISRRAAIAAGQRWFFTGRPCKFGHVAKRNVGNYVCRRCGDERQKRRRISHPEVAHAKDRRRYWKDPEKSRRKLRETRLRHIEKRRAYDRERYQSPERKAWQKEQAKRWRQANPEKRREIVRRNNAKRRGKQ